MPFSQIKIGLDARRFVELYLSNGRNQQAAYRHVFPERCAKRDEQQVIGDANTLLKRKNVQRYIVECEARLQALADAGDPLADEKRETARAAIDSAAAELANAAVVQRKLDDKAGIVDAAEPDPEVPVNQPLALIHCTVGEPDLVGQSVEIIAYSKAWVLRMAETNLARALQIAEVRDAKGRPTGMYVYNGAVANKAIELIAKIEGHLVDRKIIDHRTLDDLTDDEIRLRKAAIVRQMMEDGGDPEDIEYKEAR